MHFFPILLLYSAWALGAEPEQTPELAFAFVEEDGKRLLSLRLGHGDSEAHSSEVARPGEIAEAFCPDGKRLQLKFLGKHVAKPSGECEEIANATCADDFTGYEYQAVTGAALKPDDACLLTPKGYFKGSALLRLDRPVRPCSKKTRTSILAKAGVGEVARCDVIAQGSALTVYKVLLHRPETPKRRGETPYAFITALEAAGRLVVEEPVFNDDPGREQQDRCAMFTDRPGAEGVLFAFTSQDSLYMAKSYVMGPSSVLELWKAADGNEKTILWATRRWCHL